jgi:hypothetical protein
VVAGDFFVARVMTPRHNAMASVLQRLKDAASFKPTKRTVTLTNGDQLEFWSTPLTMAEREAATDMLGGDTPNGFALNLLVLKAADDTGRRLFQAGEIAELKNEVLDADLQAMMLAVITNPEEPKKLDMKSSQGSAKA